MIVVLHVERSDEDIVWWAESPDQAGFSATAPTLAELKVLVVEAIAMEGWSDPEYWLGVGSPEPAAESGSNPDVRDETQPAPQNKTLTAAV